MRDITQKIYCLLKQTDTDYENVTPDINKQRLKGILRTQGITIVIFTSVKRVQSLRAPRPL